MIQTDHNIIRTRILPPRRRSELVSRPRLSTLLNELIDKRLVLISAPAGYGKTSLLVDFVHQSELPVCWYSIDKLDFDPLRFISYFTAAIQQKFPAFGQRSLSAISDGQGKFDVEYLATVIINDLYDHVDEHFLLILDDYHLVNESLQVRNFMSRILQDVDENCHIIITSRTLVALPVLPIMAARSQVDGISYEELAFRPDEIQRLYLQGQRQHINMEKAEEILQRTEGWVTGIVLTSQMNSASEAARIRLNRVSGVGIDEYFRQVMDNLPPDVQRFLLFSSILEEFNADRCSVVIGNALPDHETHWKDWMRAIQHNNLFTLPVGDQGDWLRYHPLFLEYLQSRVAREFPQEKASIDRNLAKECMTMGDWDRAFSIYHRMGEITQLVEVIESAGPDILASGRISTLSAWLDVLPREILDSRPFIVAMQGYIAMALGDTALALELHNQAISAMSLPENRVTLARALTMRATLLRLMGKLDSAILDAKESTQLIQNDLDMRKTQGDNLRCIGLCMFHQGNLQEALNWLQKSLYMMTAIQDKKAEAILNLEIGLVYENQGDYNKSKQNYLDALEYWKQVQNPIWLSNLLNNLGVLYQMMGDYEEASRAFENALEYARSSGYARMEAFVLTGIGDVYAELQAYEQANQAYSQAEVIADRIKEHFLQVYIKVQRASISGQQNRLAEGFELLDEARNLVGTDGSAMEKGLIDLEFAGLKILSNKAADVVRPLERTCAYFTQEGHKVQSEKTHLYLVLAYQNLNQPEKLIEHMLRLLASLDGDYPPAALIATAARYQDKLASCQFNYMQDEIQQFFLKIEQYQTRLPELRKYLREHARAVPFAPPSLHIRALGKMSATLNGRLITSSEWQTQFARDMFFMLLAHPEGMTKEEISVIFWPEASQDEVKFRFKNTVYRLRHALGKDSVFLDQDIYRFNNGIDYEYDVELFLKENALAVQSKEPLKKLAHFREAIKHYKGSYLPDISETWVISPRECLRQNFITILLQVSETYLTMANYDLALDYCQRAITEDNLMEDAYRLSLKIYAAMGNKAGLIRQYQRCVEVFQEEINAEPSKQTQSLFHELSR